MKSDEHSLAVLPVTLQEKKKKKRGMLFFWGGGVGGGGREGRGGHGIREVILSHRLQKTEIQREN